MKRGCVKLTENCYEEKQNAQFSISALLISGISKLFDQFFGIMHSKRFMLSVQNLF